MNAVSETVVGKQNRRCGRRHKADSARQKPSIRRVSFSEDDSEYTGISEALSAQMVIGPISTLPRGTVTDGWDEAAARALIVCTLSQRDLEGLTLWQMVGRVMDTTGWSHLRAVPFVAGAIDAATVLRWAREAERFDASSGLAEAA